MLRVNEQLDKFNDADDPIKKKLKFIQEQCGELFEDYETSNNKVEKQKLLHKLLVYQKAFDSITQEIENEDDYIREVTALRISFEKVEKEVIYFGGLDEMEDTIRHSQGRKPGPHDGHHEKHGIMGKQPSDSIYNRSGISSMAFEEYKREMAKYQNKKNEFEHLSENEKRKQIDQLLEDYQNKAGYSILTEKFAPGKGTHEVGSFLKVQEEIQKLDEHLKKETDSEKRKKLEEQKRDLKKASGLMIGLTSVYEYIFTGRNPIVRFFKFLFSSKQKSPKPADDVLSKDKKGLDKLEKAELKSSFAQSPERDAKSGTENIPLSILDFRSSKPNRPSSHDPPSDKITGPHSSPKKM